MENQITSIIEHFEKRFQNRKKPAPELGEFFQINLSKVYSRNPNHHVGQQIFNKRHHLREVEKNIFATER